MASETPPGEQSVSTGSPGQRLRAIRESRHLSREDVAAQLRLDVWIIEALERDDYEALPSPVFVRGYLRNCATLLGVDASELVAESSPVVRPEIPPRPRRRVGRPPLRLPRIPWRAVGMLLLIGMLGAALAAWGPGLVNRFRDRVQADDESAHRLMLPGQTSLPGEEVSPGLPPAELPHSNAQGEIPEANNSQSVEAPVDDTQTTPISAVLPERPEAPREETLAMDGTAAPELPLDEVAAAAVPAVPEPPAEVPAAQTLSIELQFREESWVEMKAADGKRLLYGLMKTGQNRRVEGEPPVAVVLGNAKGVEITVDGKRFEPPSYTRGGVARFHLEQN
jgi:cytoskeleton protein RodZ